MNCDHHKHCWSASNSNRPIIWIRYCSAESLLFLLFQNNSFHSLSLPFLRPVSRSPPSLHSSLSLFTPFFSPPYLLSLPPPPCAVVSHSYESKIIYSRSILLANKPRWLNFTIQLFQTISKADLFDFHHSHSFEFLVSEIWNTFTLRFIRWSVLHDLLTNCFARVRFHWTNCWHFILFSIFLFCFFSFTVFGCSTGNSKYNSSFCIYFAADDDDGVVSPCWLVTTL